MKLLPCRGRTPEGRSGRCSHAFTGKLPGPLSPYVIGRAPSHFPFAYTCSRCHLRTTLDHKDFNSLPRLTLSELRELGMEHTVLNDLAGAGVSREQLAELEAAVGSDLHLLRRL